MKKLHAKYEKEIAQKNTLITKITSIIKISTIKKTNISKLSTT